jgi:hypothetical protein
MELCAFVNSEHFTRCRTATLGNFRDETYPKEYIMLNIIHKEDEVAENLKIYNNVIYLRLTACIANILELPPNLLYLHADTKWFAVQIHVFPKYLLYFDCMAGAIEDNILLKLPMLIYLRPKFYGCLRIQCIPTLLRFLDVCDRNTFEFSIGYAPYANSGYELPRPFYEEDFDLYDLYELTLEEHPFRKFPELMVLGSYINDRHYCVNTRYHQKIVDT